MAVILRLPAQSGGHLRKVEDSRKACLSCFCIRTRFDLIESDRRVSNPFYFKHNLIDSRFTPIGLMLYPVQGTGCKNRQTAKRRHVCANNSSVDPLVTDRSKSVILLRQIDPLVNERGPIGIALNPVSLVDMVEWLIDIDRA